MTTRFQAANRAQVLDMMEHQDAQVVEVLPAAEFGQGHIAGAVNIPLKELEARIDELDRSRPVVVYCNDFL